VKLFSFLLRVTCIIFERAADIDVWQECAVLSLGRTVVKHRFARSPFSMINPWPVACADGKCFSHLQCAKFTGGFFYRWYKYTLTDETNKYWLCVMTSARSTTQLAEQMSAEFKYYKNLFHWAFCSRIYLRMWILWKQSYRTFIRSWTNSLEFWYTWFGLALAVITSCKAISKPRVSHLITFERTKI